ncbi:MAG: hypothetical protein ABI905_17155 [Betaproteobacteria bacterium]
MRAGNTGVVQTWHTSHAGHTGAMTGAGGGGGGDAHPARSSIDTKENCEISGEFWTRARVNVILSEYINRWQRQSGARKMVWVFLQVFLAFGVAVFIVWWTFPRNEKGSEPAPKNPDDKEV